MADYQQYKAEDFLLDESFQRWKLDNAPVDTAFWHQWKADHPDRLLELRRAEQLLTLLLAQPRHELDVNGLDLEIDKLVLRVSKAQPSVEIGRVRSLYNWQRWVAAACVLIVIGLGFWYTTHRPTEITTSDNPLAAVVDKNTQQERVNRGQHPINILLPDGSLVVLAPKSRLSYPNQFDPHFRSVGLTGEAFFEVSKDPTKPFVVYTRQTVTKVLGTSFRVRSTNAGPVTVSVRTGRVSVYGRTDYEGQKRDSEPVNGLLLTPNQQAVYSATTRAWRKEPIVSPALLNKQAPSQQQTFDNASVASILKTLQQTYGIPLVFDETALANCPLTTTFTDENLTERIGIICQAIGASYEVVGEKIIVTGGSGCR